MTAVAALAKTRETLAWEIARQNALTLGERAEELFHDSHQKHRMKTLESYRRSIRMWERLVAAGLERHGEGHPKAVLYIATRPGRPKLRLWAASSQEAAIVADVPVASIRKAPDHAY